MAPVGPQLPPSMGEKRKRDADADADADADNTDNTSSDSETGLAPPSRQKATPPDVKKTRVIGPSLPPTSQASASKAGSENDSESSDDEDDFGPSLPSFRPGAPSRTTAATALPSSAPAPVLPSKRDDWMMVPPSSGDWSARVDPTKLKNRKFNTGKGAKGPSSAGGGATDSWHETPQEKQARLQREMMGIRDTSTRSVDSTRSLSEKVDTETAKRLKEYNKSRGPTLYEAHQKGQTADKDDDPSARAFDREKDIGGGLQINATQRRDMMKKASDFSSRFSSAKYL